MKHVPLGLKRFFFHLFPRPTITFYLHNSAAILHERRPEESIEELERQMNLFEQMRSYLHPIDVITADQEADARKVQEMVWVYLLREWY